MAGLAMLAASAAMEKGDPIPPLKTVKKEKPKTKSASLQRMLRKARP